MNYEVTETEIKVTDGVSTYVCKYDALPEETLPLVMESKASLLQEINLDDMLTNLDNSAELIYIAFCALHGKSMQADLDGLQVDLLKLCGKSKVTMTTFRDQSKDITKKILESYSWMKDGFIDEAKTIFDSTSKYAAQMAKTSQELSKEFEGLADRTTDVLKKVEVEHASEIKNKEQIENELKSMEAEKAKQESLAKSLNEDLTTLNIEYQEEKSKLAAAEKKESTMAIVSAITGALSLGISTAINAASSQNVPGVNTEEINKLSTQKQQNATKETELKTKQKETQECLEKYRNELVDLKNEQSTLQEQLANKTKLLAEEENEEMKASLQKEVDDLTSKEKSVSTKITAKEDEISKTEKSLKDYTAELQGVSAALKSITDSLAQMQQKAQNAVDSHSKKVTDLLNKKLQMEKEKRDSLAEMEKFVLLIKQNKDKVITTDTAIEMLLVAIRCLKKVAAALITASMFWESLKQYCEKLADSTVNQLLLKLGDYPEEKQIKLITNKNFVSAIITYAAQWAAMFYVCDEYYQAANKTYQHTEKNFKSMPNATEAMQIAQNRSSAILSGINAQQRDAEHAMIELEKQKKEIAESKNILPEGNS